MQLTGNYGLKKPDSNDSYNIQNENDNMDIIDRELNNISAANTDIYVTTNIGNNYSISVPDLTALTDGYPITVKFNATSTGVITMNPSGLGAKNVVDYFGNQVTNVRTNLIANLRYESTSGNFQLLGKGGGGDATAAQLLIGKKATVNSGPIVGTLDLSNLISANIKSGVTINGITGKSNVVDTTDATATSADIVSGKTGYVNGVKITGTATIGSLGGKGYKEGTITTTSPTYITTADLGFAPRVFVAHYPLATHWDFVNGWRQDTDHNNLDFGFSISGTILTFDRHTKFDKEFTVRYYAWE